MTPNRFEEVFDETVDLSREVLVNKAREYAGAGDRLHNFKQAAHLGQETAIQALGGMMMKKHTVSVYDMIQSGQSYSLAQWDEKIGDHINYLILLRALVIEDSDTALSSEEIYQETLTAMKYHTETNTPYSRKGKHA